MEKDFSEKVRYFLYIPSYFEDVEGTYTEIGRDQVYFDNEKPQLLLRDEDGTPVMTRIPLIARYIG